MSRDWRTWVALIAAVSFTIALFQAISARSELVVMEEGAINEILRASGLVDKVGGQEAKHLMV